MRSTLTMYVTFIHTDRLPSLFHSNLDSGGGALLVLRKMASMIESPGCQSGTRRADPVKYGRSRVRTRGYGR